MDDPAIGESGQSSGLCLSWGGAQSSFRVAGWGGKSYGEVTHRGEDLEPPWSGLLPASDRIGGRGQLMLHLEAVPCAELLVDVLEMRLDSVLAHVKPLRDLAPGQPVNGKMSHLPIHDLSAPECLAPSRINPS